MIHDAESSTGMPSGFPLLKRRKTRRGGRAGRKHGSPQEHLKRTGDALKAGDHAGAKAAAFALIKALPLKERDEIEAFLDKDDAQPTPKAPSPQTPASDPRSRLALALRTKKA